MFIKKPLSTKVMALALSIFASSGAIFGASVDELVKQGDVYDQKFNPTEALKYYLPAEKLEPDNVDILLRIARQYRHQMADTASMTEKSRLSGCSFAYAKRALALSPKNAETHLSVAICHAKSLEIYGNKEKMAALRELKCCADKAISLNPNNDLAYYILGRWNQRVADLGSTKRKIAEFAYGGLPKATYDDAVKCYRKAISINPKRCVYQIDMGITCASMGNKADAKTFIQKGLALPTQGKDDPETKNRGKETLHSL
jgi:tetratricopeptide (TPR) repeat protein